MATLADADVWNVYLRVRLQCINPVMLALAIWPPEMLEMKQSLHAGQQL